MLYVLFSFEEEGYNFNVEIASEDFNKIKDKAFEIGGLDLTELKPELNDERGWGGNYGVKGYVNLGLKDSRQYIVQGKEFDWPQDEKLYALFFNGDTIDWEGELLSIGCEEKVWSEFLDHLENGMEEVLDTVVDLSLSFQRGEPLEDTSENEYFLKEIKVI